MMVVVHIVIMILLTLTLQRVIVILGMIVLILQVAFTQIFLLEVLLQENADQQQRVAREEGVDADERGEQHRVVEEEDEVLAVVVADRRRDPEAVVVEAEDDAAAVPALKALTRTLTSGTFQRHDVPTGFLWWRQQNVHLFAHAKDGVASMHW